MGVPRTADAVALVEFELAGSRYAIAMDRVVELASMVRTRELPGAPLVVDGLVNHRGVAIPLVSLRRVFSLPAARMADDHLIIARGRTRRYALRVDRVHGLRTSLAADLDGAVPSRHIRGVVVEGGQLVLVQDLDALLSLEDEAALERSMAFAS